VEKSVRFFHGRAAYATGISGQPDSRNPYRSWDLLLTYLLDNQGGIEDFVSSKTKSLSLEFN
jgi:hypothetical protein